MFQDELVSSSAKEWEIKLRGYVYETNSSKKQVNWSKQAKIVLTYISLKFSFPLYS